MQCAWASVHKCPPPHENKKDPHMEKREHKGPHMVKKAPHKYKKNVAKRPLHGDMEIKKLKGHPCSKKNVV